MYRIRLIAYLLLSLPTFVIAEAETQALDKPIFEQDIQSVVLNMRSLLPSMFIYTTNGVSEEIEINGQNDTLNVQISGSDGASEISYTFTEEGPLLGYDTYTNLNLRGLEQKTQFPLMNIEESDATSLQKDMMLAVDHFFVLLGDMLLLESDVNSINIKMTGIVGESITFDVSSSDGESTVNYVFKPDGVYLNYDIYENINLRNAPQLRGFVNLPIKFPYHPLQTGQYILILKRNPEYYIGKKRYFIGGTEYSFRTIYIDDLTPDKKKEVKTTLFEIR